MDKDLGKGDVGNHGMKFSLNRLHLLICQSESSVPAAPAANPTCWWTELIGQDAANTAEK